MPTSIDDMIAHVTTLTPNPNIFPRFNILKIDDSSFQIDVAVPGFSQSGITSVGENSILTVNGTKTDSRTMQYQGIPNDFSREFSFPAVSEVTTSVTSVADGFAKITVTVI